jgi:hypothetical protein
MARRETAEATEDRLAQLVCDPEQASALHALLGPFCHRSRNLLNSVRLSLYLAQHQAERVRDSAWNWVELERMYREVEQVFDRLQTICRPMSLAPVRMSLALLMEDRRKGWVERFAARGRVLELDCAGRSDVGDYDPQCLGVALDALIDWRAEAGPAGAGARLRWGAHRGRFHVEWIERGSSAGRSSQREYAGPEPLALPLLGRVVAAHGGTLKQLASAGRHLKFSWPQVVNHR